VSMLFLITTKNRILQKCELPSQNVIKVAADGSSGQNYCS